MRYGLETGLETPGLSARISPRHRLASMVCFERLCKRMMIAGTAVAALAMSAVVCLSVHVSG